MVVINGALDRLRSGYYPALFYPKLTAVTKALYSKAESVFFLQPVACSGDRFRGYVSREYPGDYQVVVKSGGALGKQSEYSVVESRDAPFKGMEAFNLVKRAIT